MTVFEVRYVVLLRNSTLACYSADDVFSADGKLLAYGCSDLSIGILDAKTLAVRCILFLIARQLKLTDIPDSHC